MVNSDKQINVRMSYELYSKSKDLADKSEWTLAAWIRKAMEEKINRDLNRAESSEESLESRVERLERIMQLKCEYVAPPVIEKGDCVKPLRRV